MKFKLILIILGLFSSTQNLFSADSLDEDSLEAWAAEGFDIGEGKEEEEDVALDPNHKSDTIKNNLELQFKIKPLLKEFGFEEKFIDKAIEIGGGFLEDEAEQVKALRRLLHALELRKEDIRSTEGRNFLDYLSLT